MFFGHIAVGLAAKPLAPKESLGVLLVSCTALDTLCGVFALTGIERITSGDPYIAWSHGLFMSVVWSVAAFTIAFLVSRNRRTSLVIGLLVFSHWVLDFISHPMMSTVPDIPLLFEGSPKVGLGLYSSPLPALVIEFGLLGAGIAFYLSKTRAVDRTGKWALWAMVAFLLSMMLSAFLPSQLMLLPVFVINLLLPIGMWIDRHRTVLEFNAMPLQKPLPAGEK